MARSRRSFAASSPARHRRLTAWELGPGFSALTSAAVQAFSSSTTAILGDGITPVIPNLTIVRIHGHMLLSLTAAAAQRDGFQWAAGIGIVTADAFGIGVTAVPNPFDDIEWPGWMWHAMGDLRTAAATLMVGDPPENPLTVPIATKSMRKLRLNEVATLVLQVGETGTATLDARAATRILVKLP